MYHKSYIAEIIRECNNDVFAELKYTRFVRNIGR